MPTEPDHVEIDWTQADTPTLVAALWCAGPVPREAIEEVERRLVAADTEAS